MTQKTDLITIVVPVYNSARFLSRCIDSIVGQTYTEFEAIFIDDGSTDDSAVIVKEYARRDSRIRYVWQENMGPDAARGKGVELAQGTYLMFVDSDDYIDDNALEELHKKIVSGDYDMVTFSIARFNDSGKRWITDVALKENYECTSTADALYQFFAKRSISGSYPAKIFRTSLFKDYSFIKNAVIGEDITGILHALCNAKKVLVSGEIYYNYYWNTDSISHSGYTERHLVSLKNYISLCERIVAMDYIDSRIIIGYLAEFEMAVATAMSRAGVYDTEAAVLLRDDMRKKWKDIASNEFTPLYMKLCIKMFAVWPRLFLFLYRILYLVTGR